MSSEANIHFHRSLAPGTKERGVWVKPTRLLYCLLIGPSQLIGLPKIVPYTK